MPVNDRYVTYRDHQMLHLKAQVELFHLSFLRQFATQIDGKLYAIKGGCNLRFFFNSIRYSEDLDIDICIVEQKTLEKKVDKILTSSSLHRLLQKYDIRQLDVTSPKQTQTTQRWKIQLHTEQAQVSYPTKIEFSRRHNNGAIPSQLEDINAQICHSYQIPPLRLSHYGLEEAISQKILALAFRSLTQARDIFDLYHLLHLGAPVLSMDQDMLLKAQEALLSVPFSDYKSQVVSFLAPDAQEQYNNAAYWDEMLNKVLSYLAG